MEQAYIINIAKAHPTEKQFNSDKPRYYHHLKMSFDWLTPRDKALAILQDTLIRYPSPDYNVTMTLWVHRGEEITADTTED